MLADEQLALGNVALEQHACSGTPSCGSHAIAIARCRGERRAQDANGRANPAHALCIGSGEFVADRRDRLIDRLELGAQLLAELSVRIRFVVVVARERSGCEHTGEHERERASAPHG